MADDLRELVHRLELTVNGGYELDLRELSAGLLVVAKRLREHEQQMQRMRTCIDATCAVVEEHGEHLSKT